MAYKEVFRMEIAELLRRWQAGTGVRAIARALGLSRNTVRKYILEAEACGVRRDGPPATEQQLARLVQQGRAGPRQAKIPTDQVLGPWAERIRQWLEKEKLQLTRVQELLAQRSCAVSYMSLRRFVVRRGWSRTGRARTTVRMAGTRPGEVAEMDFGRLGFIWDPEKGRRRLAWALVIVLVYSRHGSSELTEDCFVWPLFRQQLVDIIEGLEAAWAFFRGVPRYLVLDNFPAAVAGADPLHPRLTRGFLEYAQHRGFFADPTRVRHPSQVKDKPHVERGLQYVQGRFFRGGAFNGLPDLRGQARHWCLEIAGQRVHGTHPPSSPGGVPGGRAGCPPPL